MSVDRISWGLSYCSLSKSSHVLGFIIYSWEIIDSNSAIRSWASWSATVKLLILSSLVFTSVVYMRAASTEHCRLPQKIKSAPSTIGTGSEQEGHSTLSTRSNVNLFSKTRSDFITGLLSERGDLSISLSLRCASIFWSCLVCPLIEELLYLNLSKSARLWLKFD